MTTQQPDFIGTWEGMAHNNNGFDLDISLTVMEPHAIGEIFGTFRIAAIPCSGFFRLVHIQDGNLELRAEKTQGPCGDAESDSLHPLPDGTLLYISQGVGWEARGILQRVNR